MRACVQSQYPAGTGESRPAALLSALQQQASAVPVRPRCRASTGMLVRRAASNIAYGLAWPDPAGLTYMACDTGWVLTGSPIVIQERVPRSSYGTIMPGWMPVRRY